MTTVRYYFFLYLHIIILAAWYTSPLYLDWRLVILTVAVYYLQLYVAKGCLLTRGQFGKENEGFYYHYLRKFGFHPDKQLLSFVLDFGIPITMILISLYRRFVV